MSHRTKQTARKDPLPMVVPCDLVGRGRLGEQGLRNVAEWNNIRERLEEAEKGEGDIDTYDLNPDIHSVVTGEARRIKRELELLSGRCEALEEIMERLGKV